MNTNITDHIHSAIQTFVATFVTTIGTELAAIPTDSLFNIQTWTTAFMVGIVLTAVRAGVKLVYPVVLQYVFPA